MEKVTMAQSVLNEDGSKQERPSRSRDSSSILPLTRENSKRASKCSYENEGSEILIECISDWSFNIFTLNTQKFIQLSLQVASDLNLLETYNIQTATWINFIRKVEYFMSLKSVNPYHNYRHIMDVMHTCYLLVKEFHAADYLVGTDVFVLIVSAIVHDLDHPGTSNAFQIHSASPLAILYNDMSVLENHHAATAFTLFQKYPECNILSNIDNIIQYRDIRKNIINCVLATDMAFHFNLVGEIKQVVKRYVEQKTQIMEAHSTTVDGLHPKLSDADRITFLKTMLHAADISNPAKTWTVAKKWSDLVVDEFFLQGDLEREAGLDVTPHCNRYTAHQDEISINFIDHMVAPLYLTLQPLMPKLASVISCVINNREQWDVLLRERLCHEESKSVDGNDSHLDDMLEIWIQKKLAFDKKMSICREEK